MKPRFAVSFGIGIPLVCLLAAPGLAASPARRGAPAEALYAQRCAVCHGRAGRGDGPAAGLLTPRPRDFTAGQYKFRSTASGTLPTQADVARTIRRGLPGTSMPAFEDLLAGHEIEDLVRFVLGLAPDGARAGAPIALGAAPPRTPQAVARGEAMYRRAGCAKCHGADGRAAGWRPEREGPGGPQPPPDLSTPWAFRGGSDAASVALRLLTGLDGSSMPSFAKALGVREAWEVAYHLETLARRPAWQEADHDVVRTAGVAADPLERGRYLVNAMLCPLCHTPISPETGAYDTRFFLAGGMRVSAYPWGVWYSRNLTPDPDTGLGEWSEAEIVTAVRRGIAREGRRLHPMAMPWPWFAHLTETDAGAIAAYLKRLPPVRNRVPLPEPVAWAEAVGGKLLALLGAEVAVKFWGGNAAADPSLRGTIPQPEGRRPLALTLGWGTLLVPIALVGVGIVRRGRPGLWGWGGILVLGAWVLLGAWPPLGLMRPEITLRWLFMGAPALPASLAGASRALAERGEYVATIAPCGLCHTPAGAFAGFYTGLTMAGGMEGRWRVYGSAVSTNLTAHPRDGIGAVPDATLVRGMRSGIGRDGRAMHWQAMPWDILSHWSEEDQRAMLAYLRALPPVAGAIPPPRGPHPGDPPADAFFFGDAARGRGPAR